MNLSQRIKQPKKQYTIQTFKKNYPEVYEWFQSEYFSNLFLTSNSVSLERHYVVEGYFTPRVCEGYPWKDSEGVVDVDDIVEYLEVEGFHTNIEKVGLGFTTIDVLVITL